MDVEHQLISKVVWTGDFRSVSEAGVTARFFHDIEHATVWDFIIDFYGQYGKVPGRDALRMEYPNYKLLKVPETVQYCCDQITKSHKRAEVYQLTADISEATMAEDPDKALSLMTESYKILEQVVKTTDAELIEHWPERMERWQTLAEREGTLIGIPTGFKFIDDVTGGLQPEQFIVLIGPDKSGKSSIAMRMAISANDFGAKVMLESFEMSNREQEARHDAIRGGFNPNQLLWGQATGPEKQRLEKALRRAENNSPFLLVHDMGSRSLSGMIAKAQQNKPDLLIIDGVYLMDAEMPDFEAGSTSTVPLSKISRACKYLAQELKIPIFVTTQALRGNWSVKQGLTSRAVGYTSAFSQDCDVMLGIEPADDDNIAKLRVVSGRHVGKHMAYITFDWDTGTIEERENWDGGDDDDDD